MTDQVDPTALRRALGSYVTGVTVVTTRGPGGERAGLTVNSFSSVSLSPPLLLWSLALSAASFEVFEHASHFAVNVLAQYQIHLAEQFALSGGENSSLWTTTTEPPACLYCRAPSRVSSAVTRFAIPAAIIYFLSVK